MEKRKAEEEIEKPQKKVFLSVEKKEEIETLLNSISDIQCNFEENISEFFSLPYMSKEKEWSLSFPKVEDEKVEEEVKEEVEEEKEKEVVVEEENKIDFHSSLLEWCSLCCEEQEKLGISNQDIYNYLKEKKDKKYKELYLFFISLINDPEKEFKKHLEEFVLDTLLLQVKKRLEKIKETVEEELNLINKKK